MRSVFALIRLVLSAACDKHVEREAFYSLCTKRSGACISSFCPCTYKLIVSTPSKMCALQLTASPSLYNITT